LQAIGNLSRLNRLITPAQLAEGKSLVEPDVVSDDEDKHFIDQVQSGVCDQNINDILGCYINLPESDNPEQNPLSYAYIREQQQADPKLLATQ